MSIIHRVARLGLISLCCQVAIALAPATAGPAPSSYQFGGGPGDGAGPYVSLIAGPPGGQFFFGTTGAGGSKGQGTVVALIPPSSASGNWTENVVYNFCSAGTCSDGAFPTGRLTYVPASVSGQATDVIYGTTQAGGQTAKHCPNGCGIVFALTPMPASGTCPSGSNPGSGWCEQVLYSFAGLDGLDAAAPSTGLVYVPASGQIPATLYGTSIQGGRASSGHCSIDGCGTVFALTQMPTSGGCPAGNNTGNGWCEQVIYLFLPGRTNPAAASPGSDGGFNPIGGLTYVPASGQTPATLYGTTAQGGSYVQPCAGANDGCGTVFALTAAPSTGNCPSLGIQEPGWCEQVLYSFAGGTDGIGPQGDLTYVPSTGTLYGTTLQGGGTSGAACYPYQSPSAPPANSSYSCGTVFALTPLPASGNCTGSNAGNGWCEQVLYSFVGGTDGFNPQGNLIYDQSSDKLYGTTIYGGGTSSNCSSYVTSCGTLFGLKPITGSCPSVTNQGAGWCEAVLHAFVGGSDGYSPDGLVYDPNSSMLYGSALAGGNSNCSTSTSTGCGLVFAVNTQFQMFIEFETKILTANPIPSHFTGEVRSMPVGIACTGLCSAPFDFLQSVTLTAVTRNPANGWSFSGWKGCATPDGNKCTVTIGGEKTVTAIYTWR